MVCRGFQKTPTTRENTTKSISSFSILCMGEVFRRPIKNTYFVTRKQITLRTFFASAKVEASVLLTCREFAFSFSSGL